MASRSTRGAIPWGRLCNRAGMRWVSTSQPRRSTIWRIGGPSAPQAMMAVLVVTSVREGQLVDESVVEVGSVGELDVLHLVEQGHRAGPLAHAEQRHLGPF